jgi:hypothetical protein
MTMQVTTAAPTNGATPANELFALTDEQIVEIEPQEAVAKTSSESETAKADPSASSAKDTDFARDDKETHRSDAAETPETIAEAKALKELYPKGIEQARAAAERARALDEFDAAYFGVAGKSAEEIGAARAALAQRMLREDPAAFREMVYAGIKALEELHIAPPFRAASSSDSTSTTTPNAGLKAGATQSSSPPSSAAESQIAAYSEFEKSANADLEKSVSVSIDRALRQALPNAKTGEGDALLARLGGAVRQEIEKALQGDRQLGEQVAQVLSARRFDDATRAQVVRLINERAQQLVPSATKRVLNDWTQTTLAAHRAKTEKQEAASERSDLAPAQPGRETPRLQPGKTSQSSARNDSASARTGRIDYKKLSDEQILEL